jgi:SAM-dependent methyltransferase
MDETCDFCGGARFRRLPYYYNFRGGRIYGVRCLSCGLITVSPKPSKEELAGLYDGEYFERDYHCGHRDGAYEDESFTEEHGYVLGMLSKLKPAGRMLEIGAAGGKFLARARDLGYDVMGVEVSADACGMAEKLGLKHFCGELEDARFPSESFDVIYMGDVMEHLPRPFSTLKEVYRISARGAVVSASCPTNIGLISSRVGLLAYALLGRERAAPIPPYHLYEFTPRAMEGIFKGAGFEVEALKVDIIPPWRINLRGGPMEKAFKAAFHWPNYLITRLTGLMGDRATIFVRKP